MMLTRMLAYFTLFFYLVVGTVAVRFLAPKSIEFSVSSQYFSMFDFKLTPIEPETKINASEIVFAEIKIPTEKIITRKKYQKMIPVLVEKLAMTNIIIGKNELPFKETIFLTPVNFQNSLIGNHLAFFRDISIKENSVAAEKESKTINDEVSTSLASTEALDAEPDFFEYPVKEVTVTKVEEKKQDETIDTRTEVKGSEVSGSQSVVSSVPATEEVALDELVTFDYSKAKLDIQANSMPTITGASIQSIQSSAVPVGSQNNSQPSNPSTEQAPEIPVVPRSEKNNLLAPDSADIQVTIQVSGTDLKKMDRLNDYRIRFQDDSSELGDLGTGEITISDVIASEKTTRSAVILKPGFIPTNTDLILSNDFNEFLIPLLEEETYNKEIAPFESNGPMGAVLVEVDDSTELAQLDVDFDKVILLDGNMKVTKRDDFRYQLFVGVNAGNATISYKGSKGIVTKTIHVHERELTYESNLYEEAKFERIKIFEEDLMAKEKSPLITSGDSIKILNTKSTALKISNNGYKLNFGFGNLAGRRYLELNHHSSLIFVGLRNSSSLTLPSENLRNYIEQYKTAGSCLIQVNLNKKILSIDIDSESVERSLMTTTQMLDMDGKFYDTASEKTRKVIIVGETQANGNTQKEAKINIKIENSDGSKEYLNTFCIPGTYLVEQL